MAKAEQAATAATTLGALRRDRRRITTMDTKDTEEHNRSGHYRTPPVFPSCPMVSFVVSQRSSRGQNWNCKPTSTFRGLTTIVGRPKKSESIDPLNPP